MGVVTSTGDEGIVISDLTVDGVPSYTHDAGDCTFGTYAGATKVWDGFALGTGQTITTPVLNPSLDYFIEASGTYFAGGGAAEYDIQAFDAEYSQDYYQRTHGLDWTDSVHLYESFGEGLLELTVNGGNVEWGAYNDDHRYTMDVPSGSSLALEANIYDPPDPTNNVGGLRVALFVKNHNFTGFFRPVDNQPEVNSVKAGQAIPVKFSLSGDKGRNIIAAGYPALHKRAMRCRRSD